MADWGDGSVCKSDASQAEEHTSKSPASCQMLGVPVHVPGAPVQWESSHPKGSLGLAGCKCETPCQRNKTESDLAGQPPYAHVCTDHTQNIPPTPTDIHTLTRHNNNG